MNFSKLLRKKMRKSKDQYFMDIADVVSQQATCAKRKVGAIIVKNNNLISSGHKRFN